MYAGSRLAAAAAAAAYGSRALKHAAGSICVYSPFGVAWLLGLGWACRYGTGTDYGELTRQFRSSEVSQVTSRSNLTVSGKYLTVGEVTSVTCHSRRPYALLTVPTVVLRSPGHSTFSSRLCRRRPPSSGLQYCR